MRDLRWLTRARLDELTVEVLRPASEARPSVLIAAHRGHEVVVKDYAANGGAFKHLLGAYLTSREHAAYRNLEGMAGIPHCYGRLDPYALVMERLHAEPAYLSLRPSDLDAFIPKLRELLEEVHRRGVAHGDMHKMDNILMDEEGAPGLVDFTASFVTGSSPLSVMVMPALFTDDLRGVVKLKNLIAPDLITDEERTFLEYRPPAEAFFRSWRGHIRRAVKKYSGPRTEPEGLAS